MEAEICQTEGKRESSYGWVVVASGLIITLIIYGIIASMAVFFKPLLQSFQWSRGQTSLIWAANWVTFGVLSLFIGPLTDRFGARRMMLAGGCLFSLGIFFSSRATSLWHLFFFFGMLGSVGRAAVWTPLVATVTRWFERRRGLALGLAQSYQLGTFAVVPLAAWLVTAYGWQWAFMVLGVLALVTVVPLTFFIREPRGSNASLPQESRSAGLSRDFSLGEALGTRAFWSLNFMVLGCCVCHSFLLLHLVNHLTDQGIAISRAATIFGTMGAAGALGKIVNGLCADRFGAKPAIAGFLCVQGLGLLVFVRPDQLWLIYLGAVLWGMAQGGPMTCYPMLYREYFGERHLATVMSGLFAMVGLGMALGGLLGGILYDATGGYQLSFAVSLTTGLGAALIATTLQPPHSSSVGERRGIEMNPTPGVYEAHE
ncbi:MAG: MFS transporter [Deltaproteobacteria bacterium]|nr:MFS transporter [Deltaproteobacteria bacterium]